MSSTPGMTQAEFVQGWKLLIIQPWGWRYNQMDQNGQPTSATKQQMEFYFDKLKWAHPEAWLEVVDLFARGDKWPSVDELTQTLRQVNSKYARDLQKPEPRWEPMPDEVRAQLQRLGVLAS